MRDFINGQAETIHYEVVDTDSIFADLDTPEEYQRRRGCRRCRGDRGGGGGSAAAAALVAGQAGGDDDHDDQGDDQAARHEQPALAAPWLDRAAWSTRQDRSRRPEGAAAWLPAAGARLARVSGRC